jgi:hypothetical protein
MSLSVLGASRSGEVQDVSATCCVESRHMLRHMLRSLCCARIDTSVGQSFMAKISNEDWWEGRTKRPTL